MPVFLIALGKLFNQSESIFIKSYNKKHAKGNLVFSGLISLFIMLFFLVTDLITDETGITFNPKIFIYAIIAGVSYATAYVTTCLALKEGSFVLTGLVISYSVLVTVIQGLILGESLKILGWIGLILILCSLYLVKGDDKGDTVKVTKKWLIYVIIDFIAAGLCGIMARQQQLDFQAITGVKGIYDNEYMIATLGISALILLTIGFIKERKDSAYILRHGTLYAMGVGVSNGACNLLTLYVYTLLPMSVIAPLCSGFGILISFLFAKLIYHEKFTVLQYIGVVLGAIALILFNI